MEARQWWLNGRVQGVGFRPFVYRLALRHGLIGWVRNRAGEVEIFAQGTPQALNTFATALLETPPPLARPEVRRCVPGPLQSLDGFEILTSETDLGAAGHIAPDFFTCPDCLAELAHPEDRRYRYPFINCTQCGPRYTLIRSLPYDRSRTTMAGFPLCPDCQSEYDDPADRRFHAEPLACPACGPTLSFHRPGGPTVNTHEAALRACSAALRAGLIVAIKGIGGYHLCCDAVNEAAVQRLRERKSRPAKPLAVMVPMDEGLRRARRYVHLAPTHAQWLGDPTRPILLTPRAPNSPLADGIAPGLDEIGVMLPYSPLHQLLLNQFDGALVATSANRTGEPVLIDGDEVEQRLGDICDAYLHHNRPIERPADDSVLRPIAGAPRPLRLGRGYAPLALPLPVHLSQPLLAVGGHMKNTVALAWDNRAIISPHIGDLDSPRSMAVFTQVADDLQRLYGVRAETLVCDAHPGYASSRWAEKDDRPVHRVFHHHAHASALAAEHPHITRWLIFTWDGVGYGEDGTLWGGEAFIGRPGQWQRVASFRPFNLPGGDKAARQGWRSALALCWHHGEDWPDCPHDTALLHQAWQRGLNAPQSSAVGRLFDAAAALTGIALSARFEGQAPLSLEAHAALETGATASPVTLPLYRDEQVLWRSDWGPLLPMLKDHSLSAESRAANFHESLARVILEQTQALASEYFFDGIGLTGGVFQNRRLTEQAVTLLNEQGFEVRLATQVPGNDAGLSFGQIIEAAHAMGHHHSSPESKTP